MHRFRDTRVILSAIALFVHAASAQPAPHRVKFAVSAVKPSQAGMWNTRFTANGFYATGVTLRSLIMQNAYAVYDDKRILGGPNWLNSDRFDVEAKVDEADAAAFHNLSQEQRQEMIQALLGDRFNLVVHREKKESPVYVLTIAKGGSKLVETKPEEVRHDASGGVMSLLKSKRDGSLEVGAETMQGFADLLSRLPDVGRIVVDKTSLEGRYQIALHRAPEYATSGISSAGGPSIFTALQEQLGLKLEPSRVPVDVLVIDHAERPAGN